jgi:hypothetical protein
MMARWISEVPSQMRSTRTSRFRSARPLAGVAFLGRGGGPQQKAVAGGLVGPKQPPAGPLS